MVHWVTADQVFTEPEPSARLLPVLVAVAVAVVVCMLFVLVSYPSGICAAKKRKILFIGFIGFNTFFSVFL